MTGQTDRAETNTDAVFTDIFAELAEMNPYRDMLDYDPHHEPMPDLAKIDVKDALDGCRNRG